MQKIYNLYNSHRREVLGSRKLPLQNNDPSLRTRTPSILHYIQTQVNKLKSHTEISIIFTHNDHTYVPKNTNLIAYYIMVGIKRSKACGTCRKRSLKVSHLPPTQNEIISDPK